MVDFTLTDEQKDLRELAHDFSEKEIRPVAWEYDRDSTWPQEIVEKAFEVGLMNVHIPEAYGGPGLDYLSGCLIEEELGWGCSGIGTSLMANGLASAPLLIGASEETKKKYLGMLTEEPKLASFCLTEPDAGSDVSGMKTRAVKSGDKYVISGSKCFITNGSHASWYTVYAKTDPEAGHRGITAFVVDRDADGVTVDKKEDKLGQRASDTATISFDEVEVPAENMLGEENHGFKLAMTTLDRTRPGVSSLAVGIARAAFEFACRVRQGARPVRRPDRHAPGGGLHDRRHGDQDRGVPAARLGVGRAARPGQAQHAGLLAREAVRRRHRDGGHGGRRPGLRRLRVHQGVPGREADARREDHAALRGHLADPAPRDRPRDPGAAAGRRARVQPETTREETEASEKAAEQAPAAA